MPVYATLKHESCNRQLATRSILPVFVMPNPYFQFKQFTVFHDRSAMKVTTDACLFGAWCADQLSKVSLVNEDALEIGAGTGLLSLMVAQKTNLEIDAVEIEPQAAEQATENVAASPWKERIVIHESDILHFAPGKKYSCIFSNPPFYEKEITSQHSNRNVAHHSHGLKLEQLFELMKQQLHPDGLFFLLLPYKRVKEIEQLLATHQLFLMKKVWVRQTFAHQPFRLFLMGTIKPQKEQVQVEEIVIRDEQQQYTSAFVALLKDYYLYL